MIKRTAEAREQLQGQTEGGRGCCDHKQHTYTLHTNLPCKKSAELLWFYKPYLPSIKMVLWILLTFLINGICPLPYTVMVIFVLTSVIKGICTLPYTIQWWSSSDRLVCASTPSAYRGSSLFYFSSHTDAVNTEHNRYTDTRPSYVTIRETISGHFLLPFHSSAFQLTWPDRHANHKWALSTSCMKRIMLWGWCSSQWEAPPLLVTTKFAPVIYQVPPVPQRGRPVPWPACCSCGAAVQYVHFSHGKRKVLICPALLSLMDLLLSYASVPSRPVPPPHSSQLKGIWGVLVEDITCIAVSHFADS